MPSGTASGPGKEKLLGDPWGRWHSCSPTPTLHALNSSASLRLTDSVLPPLPAPSEFPHHLAGFQVGDMGEREGDLASLGSCGLTEEARGFPTFPSSCPRQGRALAAMGEGLPLAFSSPWRSPCLTQAICPLTQRAENEPPTQERVLPARFLTFSDSQWLQEP